MVRAPCSSHNQFLIPTMATVKEVLTLAQSAASVIPVPFLKEAIIVALRIIQLCEVRWIPPLRRFPWRLIILKIFIRKHRKLNKKSKSCKLGSAISWSLLWTMLRSRTKKVAGRLLWRLRKVSSQISKSYSGATYEWWTLTASDDDITAFLLQSMKIWQKSALRIDGLWQFTNNPIWMHWMNVWIGFQMLCWSSRCVSEQMTLGVETTKITISPVC